MKDVKSKPPALVGVIGQPIGHSLSPAIHNYWMRRHGIKGYYIPIEIARENLAEAIKALPKMNFRGVNITLPHKESILHSCDSVSDEAALMGAVNTLTISESGRIHGDNTDGFGFLESLTEGRPGWRADAAPILVLGAGGAARGIIHALIAAGAEEIHVANRTREKADSMRSDFGVRVMGHGMDSITKLVAKMGTVINTTSLGMTGKPPVLFPYASLKENTVVLDLVYTPLETEFIQQSRARNCITIDGLGMFLHQAAFSFNHWFNVKPEVTQSLRHSIVGE
ncbi:MAG: shikimate dehydrogenase [Rhodobacteraceae bacterium]|nr:shikimate dehydrogenase [Paracoccaceae bacterium]MCY4327965.1 shikimate dehydrogenase [Paracoccaceae bacterium]